MAKLLEDILKQKQEQQKASGFEHVAVRQEWIANCEKLMSKIAMWLQPLKDKNWLEIQSENISRFGKTSLGITKPDLYDSSF